MRTCVFGAGAVGSYLGASFAAAGHEVTLVCRPDAAAVIAEQGVAIASAATGAPLVLTRPQVSTSLRDVWEAGDFELVVLAMKSYDVAAALDELALVAVAPPPLLSVQNGIGLEEAILERFPGCTVIAASVTVPLSRPVPARVVVERTGRGMTLAPTRPEQDVGRWVQQCRQAGIATTVVEEHRRLKWSKALLNMIGNATAAILNMHPGDIYQHPAGFALEAAMLREVLAVMSGLGIPVVDLPGSPARQLARALRWLPAIALRPLLGRLVRGGRGAKLPSFLIDLNAGKPVSEVSYHNGAVATAGSAVGLATPVNFWLNEILVGLVNGRLDRATYAGQPAALLAATRRAATAPLQHQEPKL